MKKRKHVISLILSPMFTKNIGAQNIITNKLSLFKTRNKCSKIRCHKQRNISTPNTIRVGCFEGDWREMWFVPNGVGWVPQERGWNQNTWFNTTNILEERNYIIMWLTTKSSMLRWITPSARIWNPRAMTLRNGYLKMTLKFRFCYINPIKKAVSHSYL